MHSRADKPPAVGLACMFIALFVIVACMCCPPQRPPQELRACLTFFLLLLCPVSQELLEHTYMCTSVFVLLNPEAPLGGIDLGHSGVG